MFSINPWYERTSWHNDLFPSNLWAYKTESVRQPDTYEHFDDHAMLYVELAGVKKEDITLSAKEGQLTVAWKDRKGAEQSLEYRLKKVATDQISSTYEDGLLSIRLPYTAAAVARTIPVS